MNNRFTRRLYLRENTIEIDTAITIDGFTVGTANNFNITKEYIIKRFKEFNKKYFDSTLKIEDIGEFKVFPYKNTLGSVYCKAYSNYCEITSFKISNYFDRSEKVYCETILHEMIHIFQEQILYPLGKYSFKDISHGVTFLKKMEFINSFGWNVAVKETTEEYLGRGNKNSEILKKEEIQNDYSKYYLFVYIPEDTRVINSKSSGRVGFNIIDKNEAIELMPILQLYNCQKNYFHPEKRVIYVFEMEDSSLTRILQKFSYFSPRKRVVLKNYKKSVNRLDYIGDRTFSYKYESLLDLEEKGLIKNIEGKKLPQVGEKLSEAKIPELNRFNLLKKTIEKDPYVKVLGIHDDGGIEIEVS